ncbi:MAG: putative RNA-binding protein 25, variant 2 [Marteilia pararefringens]
MLRTCGAVADWKRASGSNGTMQPFGFVKFDDYESTLRAIRLMNGFKIGKKCLVVKLSDEDEKKLNKYKEDKRVFLAKIGKQLVASRNWQKSLAGQIDDAQQSELSNDVLSQEELQYDNNINQKLHSIASEYDEYIQNPMLHQSVSQNFLRTTMAKHMQNRDHHYRPSPLHYESSRDFMNELPEKKELEKKATEVKAVLSLKSGPLDLDQELSEEESEPESFTAGILNLPNNINKQHILPEASKNASQSVNNVSTLPIQLKTNAMGDLLNQNLQNNEENEKNETNVIEEHRMYLQKLKEKVKNYNKLLKCYEARERRQQRAYIYEENALREENILYHKNLKKELDFYSNYDDDRMDKKHYYSRRFLYKLNEYQEEYKSDQEVLEYQEKVVKSPFYDQFAEYLRFLKNPDSLKNEMSNITDNEFSDINLDQLKTSTDSLNNGHFKYIADQTQENSENCGKESAISATCADTDNVNGNIGGQVINNSVTHNKDNEIKNKMPITNNTNRQSDATNNDDQSQKDKQTRRDTFVKTIGVGGVFKNIFNEVDDKDYIEIVKSCENSINDDDDNEDENCDAIQASNDYRNTSALAYSNSSFSEKSDISNFDGSNDQILKPGSSKKFKLANQRIRTDTKEIKELRAQMYEIIDSIPTATDELFSSPLDWHLIDSQIIEENLKPWISKKIAEYLGELEPALLQFIIEKLNNTPIHAQSFLNSLAVVLDAEEATNFTANLWRLIIYTIEAKKRNIL